MSKRRFLDPRERLKLPLLKERARLREEEDRADLEGRAFPKRSELNRVNSDLQATMAQAATVICFKCEVPINLDTDHHYRLTTCCLPR